MKLFLASTLSYVVIILVCLFILVGVKIPRDGDYYREINYYVLRTYKYGLYIGQTRANWLFYNFSPYNDYYINKYNQPEKFYDYEKDGEVATQWKYNQQLSIQGELDRLLNVFLSYFRIGNPKATFKQEDSNIIYSSQIDGNVVKIKAEIAIKNSTGIENLYRTISLNETDVIVSNKYNVYYFKNQEALEAIEKTLKRELTIKNDIDPSSDEIVYIVNPESRGCLKVNENGDNIQIKRDWDVISIKKPVWNNAISITLLEQLPL